MKCHNCGAPLVNREKCEYCGSLLSLPLRINPYAQQQMDLMRQQNQIVTASNNPQWLGTYASSGISRSVPIGSIPIGSYGAILGWWQK